MRRLLPGFRVQFRPGLSNLLQPAFPPRQFLRQLVGQSLPLLLILDRVDRLGPLQQLLHFRLLRLFGPPHPPITHRLVLAGVRLEFRPVDRHMPQFHQPRLPAQSQRLQKQSRQRLQMPFPKLVERAVIRMRVRTQIPERHVLMRPFLDLPRTHHPSTISVHQQPHHQHRGVGRLTSSILRLIGTVKRRQIQRLHQVGHKSRQMIFRKPVV